MVHIFQPACACGITKKKFVGLYELSDVDECAEGIHSCSSKAECTDIDGGYYCNSTEGSISDSHGNGQLGERVTMETIVMVTDDRAVLIGLIAPLAVLSLVLAVAVTVCLTLAITYHIKRKGGEFPTVNHDMYSNISVSLSLSLSLSLVQIIIIIFKT